MKTRNSARIVLLNKENKVLLFKAFLPHEFCWFTPGGGIEIGENSYEAAKRELYEETGLYLDIGPRIWKGQQLVEWKNESVMLTEEYFFSEN